MLTERGFIARVRERAASAEPALLRAIGDDCAVFTPEPHRSLLVTTDTLVEKIHFDCRWHPPALLGRKAAAVNLSDIAAMGGEPKYSLLSLAMEPTTTELWLDQFMAGFLGGLAEQNTILIGGDTVKSDRLTISVTLIGSAEPERILYRSGALPGDLLWVSGPLGGAAAGLDLCRRNDDKKDNWPLLLQAHLDPRPRVALGRFLAASGMVHAMMDLSDGLATDLAHLCAESNCGAEVEEELLPFFPDLAAAAAHLGCSPVEYGLTGGEDYELLFTTPPEARYILPDRARAATGLEICCLGRIIEQKSVSLRQNGKRREIGYQGYEHFKSSEK
jgi:thiamine-monophosphate kinase